MIEKSVTVIIPHFNCSDLACHAIDSVFTQTLKPKEIILVDDGSFPDHRDKIINAYQEKIKVIVHENNLGAAAARNTGMRHATGDFIAFLDADDIWHPNKLRDQIAFMERHGHTFSCTGFLNYYEDSDTRQIRIPNDINSLDDVIWGCGVSPGSTAMFHRSLFSSVGEQDGTLRRLEDWDWLFDVVQETPVKIYPSPLSTIYVNHKSPHRTVQSSIKRIIQKRSSLILNRSPILFMKFLSYCMIEFAANHKANNKHFYFIICGFLAFALWPLRDVAFYRRALATVLFPTKYGRPYATIHPSASPPQVLNRCIHVISSLETGGAERMLANLVTMEASDPQRDVKSTVVTLKEGGLLEEALKEAGVEIRPIHLTKLSHLPSAIWSLIKIFREIRPSTVKCWMYYSIAAGTIALVLSGQYRKCQLVWGIRCSDMDFSRYSKTLRLSVKLCALLSSFADKIISNSYAAIRVHIALGYSNRSWSVIDNGVDIDRFQKDKNDAPTSPNLRAEYGIPYDDFVVAITARRDPMKGYDVLLRALDSLPNVWVIAGGKGTEDITGNDRFIGLGELADVRGLLWQADAFVLPSLYGEGVPNAVLEAMASGLPVVATDVGDIARVVGPCGLVVPPGNVQALINAITEIKDNAEQTNAFKTCAMQRINQNFLMKSSFERFRQALR